MPAHKKGEPVCKKMASTDIISSGLSGLGKPSFSEELWIANIGVSAAGALKQSGTVDAAMFVT